jgi:uroporphyrinogen-III synthase
MPDAMNQRPLAGRRVAILEHREQDRLGAMLEAQGAAVLRCPLVAIADAPDAAPVVSWLRRFVAAPPDDLVLMTGEGLQRLVGFAERAALGGGFRAALGRVRTITRGPKPARALRELGLAPTLRAERPTTDGVIATLAAGELRGRRVGVQLYPEAPMTLVAFLAAAGATAEPVWPYAYVASVDDEAIRTLIEELAAGSLDAIAFTSAAQVSRLFAAAAANGLLPTFDRGLHRTAVAAVGPVVAAELERRGLDVAIMPRDTYFMKPLVSAIIKAMALSPDGSTR